MKEKEVLVLLTLFAFGGASPASPDPPTTTRPTTSTAAEVQDPKPASPPGCPTCEVDFCPKAPQECSHGLVEDRCGCCKEGVCHLFEREKCLNLNLVKNISDTHLKKFGVCGEYAECILWTDTKAGETEESICKCQKMEASCGQDNTTYHSLCQLKEAGTELKHPGACKSAPELISEPEVSSTLEHEQFSLECQAKGFPVPDIRWEFEGLDGVFRSLPGDDHSIAIHNRGGPEPFTVSSWVMIEALRESDSGKYICIATNSEGVTRTVTTIHVSRKTT